MARVSLKIVGASGQGINSIGEVLAKALKRSGYCVFGYREYPSLIKGGHASYQLDVSDEEVGSSERLVDILVTLNHHGLQKNLTDVKEEGIVVHAVPNWKFSEDEKKLLESRKIRVVYLPVDDMLKKLGAKPILGNVVIAAFVWGALGKDAESLKTLVGEKFAKKPQLLEWNYKSVDEGHSYTDPEVGAVSLKLPPAQEKWKHHMLLTGSHAMGLGAVRAGVRFFAGYPMTPSSSLLTYIADIQNRTGMAIKQAEDEITAAQMVSGAMFMGTRSFTTTSGGGFDLMTETLSMDGITETPVVFVVGQRPGPGTGQPTWTAQADLLMTIGSGHGEFPRCIMAASSAADAFTLIGEAFNIAEEFQIPVILLTDKQLMEALYTQAPYKDESVTIRRGQLVTKPAQLKRLKSSDRYDPAAENGVSQRWLPGADAATYCGQCDEHTADGSSTDDAQEAQAQVAKRLRKFPFLKDALPEPELFGAEKPEILLVGWGSTKTVILDALKDEHFKGKSIGYLHYTYLYPLRVERFSTLAQSAQKIILVEGNAQGQLGRLHGHFSHAQFTDRILKYDGRPFFRDELVEALVKSLAASKSLSPSLRP
jgi:2-oxoglutarate/2-oxoacid ferredoxin oxidoreductase subunit alpha